MRYRSSHQPPPHPPQDADKQILVEVCGVEPVQLCQQILDMSHDQEEGYQPPKTSF